MKSAKICHYLKFKEIHIENTNCCLYKCKMCPRDKLSRKLGVMSVEDFKLVLQRLEYLEQFEGTFHLHGFGEALLDQNLFEKIKLLKKKFPKSKAQIISTLGVKLKNDYFLKLIDAGLDALMVSLYGFTKKTYQEIHGYDGFEIVKQNLLLLSQAQKKSNFFQVFIKSSPDLSLKPGKDFFAFLKKLEFDVGKSYAFHNFGDGRKYNAPNLKALCPVVGGIRKQILNITWDLNVIPCCYDYNSTICFGNLKKESLEQVFANEKYFNFLLRHKLGDLAAYPICQNCEKMDFA